MCAIYNTSVAAAEYTSASSNQNAQSRWRSIHSELASQKKKKKTQHAPHTGTESSQSHEIIEQMQVSVL